MHQQPQQTSRAPGAAASGYRPFSGGSVGSQTTPKLQQTARGPPPPKAAPPPQPAKVVYNNPVGLYSDGNAVEALQQMQESLAQLNSGLQT